MATPKKDTDTQAEPEALENTPPAEPPDEAELERQAVAQAITDQGDAIRMLQEGQEAQAKLNQSVLEAMQAVQANVGALMESQAAIAQNQAVAAAQPHTPTLEQVEEETRQQEAAAAEAHLAKMKADGWARFLSPVRNFVVPVEDEGMVVSGGKQKIVHPKMARFEGGVYMTRNAAHIARLRDYIKDGMPDLFEDPSLTAQSPGSYAPTVTEGIRGTRTNPQTASGPPERAPIAATI